MIAKRAKASSTGKHLRPDGCGILDGEDSSTNEFKINVCHFFGKPPEHLQALNNLGSPDTHRAFPELFKTVILADSLGGSSVIDTIGQTVCTEASLKTQ